MVLSPILVQMVLNLFSKLVYLCICDSIWRWRLYNLVKLTYMTIYVIRSVDVVFATFYLRYMYIFFFFSVFWFVLSVTSKDVANLMLPLARIIWIHSIQDRLSFCSHNRELCMVWEFWLVCMRFEFISTTSVWYQFIRLPQMPLYHVLGCYQAIQGEVSLAFAPVYLL